jgi:hypothetical protein
MKIDDFEYIYWLNHESHDLKDDEMIIGIASKKADMSSWTRLNDEFIEKAGGIKGIKKCLEQMAEALQHKYDNQLNEKENG